MWSPLVFFLAFGLATADYAWKPNTVYEYQVSGRTFASLHQVANKYVGVTSRAILTIHPKTPDYLIAKITNAQYAQVHTDLPDGWTSRIPEKALSYKQLPLDSGYFEIHLKKGVVTSMVVSKSWNTPTLNLIKSVASQLQVDTQGANAIKWSTPSQVHNLEAQKSVYRTMEDTVTGECETQYDISPMPRYAIEAAPHMAPLRNLRGEGQFYDIVKTKNYTNCHKRVAYHFGLTPFTDWEPANNKMGHFLSRSSVSRIVISGTLDQYTIQSSVTTARIILSPTLYNAQKGMVGSRMNVTLLSVRPASGSPPAVSNPRTVKDLVYEYNTPFSSEHGGKVASPSGDFSASDSSAESDSSSADDSADSTSSNSSSSENESGSKDDSDSEDSSTSESSEENPRKRPVPKRFRRHAQKKKFESSGSSSSSSEDDSEDSFSKGDGTSSSSESSSESENSKYSPDNYQSSYNSHKNSFDSSPDSSSSSEEHQPKPDMNKPPHVPLLPYFVGYQGSSVQAAKDLNVVSAVKKLCSQIAYELQNPTYMPQRGTLEKFDIVTRLVRIMSSDQIQQATSDIYAHSESSGEGPWPVFRDAVATAGTPPALTAIKQWILTKKIEGQVAAEVVAALPEAARMPTPQYIRAAFELATHEYVTKQAFLNTSAILSVTTLVRKAQVNNVTAHNYYGVHAFGRFSPIDPKDLTERYIPYLSKALRTAVRNGDSHCIQVYIRALGNLGHPKILEVFEPYLEGKEQMSTFQRTLMVLVLNKLARTYPQLTRRVLFNVYQNTAEAHEVRCAAVYGLMRTGPPAYMLQRMAEFTNQDISHQVSSAVKSAIQNAAALEGPHHRELKKNAAAAVHLLTPKQFGFHYSYSYLKSYMVKEMGLAYKQELSWIGSESSFTPKGAFFVNSQNKGGFKSQNMALGLMTSGIDGIADIIEDLAGDYYSSSSGSSGRKGKPSSSHGPFNVDTIAEMLNIQPSESEQVEGNIHFRTMGTERFYTFDNDTFHSAPHYVKAAASALRSGHSFNYHKLYYQFALTLSYPLETGLPFVYTLKCPTYMSIRGEVKAKTQPDMASGSHSSLSMPKTVNGSTSIHVVYSSRMAAKISFVAPLTHQRYIAGLDKNVQVNVPVRANFSIDVNNTRANLTLYPLYTNRDSLLFHYSTLPYTTKHNILDLSPVSQGGDHKITHVREPSTWEHTVGKDATGFAFRVKYSTEQKYVDTKWLFEKASRHDALSFALYPWAEKTIKWNNITVYLDAKRSSSKSVTFAADYSTYYDDDEGSESDEDSDSNVSDYDHKSPSSSSSSYSPSTYAPFSEKRHREYLRKASSGIRNSSTSILEMAVEFHGVKKVSYVATTAYANSDVDDKSRFLFYLYSSPHYTRPKPFEACLTYEGKWPSVPIMDYSKALKARPTSYGSMEFGFGETCQSGASKISIKYKADQTPERKEYLRRTPMSQLCMSQMQSGEYLQPACRNVTALANFLDYYTAEIHYDKLSTEFKNYTYKAYSWLRYLSFPYLDENVVNVRNKDGKVTVNLAYAPCMSDANLTIAAPYIDAEFNRVRVSPLARPILVQHPTYSAAERFLTEALAMQYTAKCSLDRYSVNTFDNTTYEARYGKCWHVAMTTQPKDTDSYSSYPDTAGVAILVREASEKKKEIKVLLGNHAFDFKPSASSSHSGESQDAAAYVIYNQKPHPVSHRRVTNTFDERGEILARWYALPSGALQFEAPQHGVFIAYNGYGATIVADSSHRDDVIGLCGTYDGEPSTDFTTPSNCIVSNSTVFVPSYLLPDHSCEASAKQMQRRGASAPCYRKTATPWEVISEDDYSAGYRSSRYNSTTRKQSSSSSSGCTHSRIQIIEEGSRTCFTMKPYPACAEKCRPTGKVERTVPVHCVTNSDASRHFVQMVKKGANPDFSRKEVSKTMKITHPQSCTHN